MVEARLDGGDPADQGMQMKAGIERSRVLLVDDNADTREMYGEYLKFCGFDVIEAANGIEALQQALESAPGIILMDMSMPVMDGWEATRRLKSDHRTAGIPIVALTSHALAGVSAGAMQAGCDAVLTKPCLPQDLVKEIRKILLQFAVP
jgi:CheY-like chemotaxis protein